jgi:tRNA(Ile)-lysidine synthetase-like protein
LLDTWRTEITAYCSSQGLTPHYDASNDSPEFLRNRVRHDLIPTLETYNPRFREAILRTAQTASSDQGLLTEALDSWWQQTLIKAMEPCLMLDLKFLSGQSPGLQRQMIRRAIEGLLPGHDTDFVTLERASAFISDPASFRMDLTGGLILIAEGDRLYAARSEAELPRDCWPQMPGNTNSIPVTLPVQVALDHGWQFLSEKLSAQESAQARSGMKEDRFKVFIDAEGLPRDLELRVRHPGDRFEPLGLNGHVQKLSDFFTNAKLPARARARWPLLCSGEEIIWVPGYRPAEKVKVKETSRNILYFALTPPTMKDG